MPYNSLTNYQSGLVDEYLSTITELVSDVDNLHRASTLFNKCKNIMNFFLETGIEELIQHDPLHNLFKNVVSKMITARILGESHYDYILTLQEKFFRWRMYKICLLYSRLSSEATDIIYEDQSSINNVLVDLARTHIMNPMKFQSQIVKKDLKILIKENPDIYELVNFSLEIYIRVYENWLSQKRMNFALDTIDYIVEIYELLALPDLLHQYKINKINLLCNQVNTPKMVTSLLTELNEFSNNGDLVICNYIIAKILEHKAEFDELMYIDVFCEIGKIYRIHGEIEKSKTSFIDATEVAKTHNVDSRLPFCYQSLGNLESLLGNSKEAEKWYKLSLDILRSQLPVQEELSNDHPIKVIISSVLFQLVRLSLSQNEIERADRYYRQLAAEGVDKDPRVKLSEALLLKSDKRLRNKMRGEQLLDELISSNLKIPEIKSIALKHRIELLLLEYKLLREDDVYLELQDLLNQLQLLSKNSGNIGTLVNSKILSSRLYANIGEFNTARDQLVDLLSLPKTASFTYYEHEVMKEIQTIDAEFEDMEKKVSKNPDYNIKLKEMQVSNYLQYIQNMLNDD